MFSASLRRWNGAKCWVCAFTNRKRGAKWVFANCRFGLSMNAEKEQLSVAHAVLRKKKNQGKGLYACHSFAEPGHGVAYCRSGENETQNLTLMPQMGQVSAVIQKNASPWV